MGSWEGDAKKRKSAEREAWGGENARAGFSPGGFERSLAVVWPA